MKSFLTTAALFAVTASADLCSSGSTDDNGNWYCQEVNAITYTGVGGSGSYNRVTNMDSNSGSCSSTPFAYSGPLAPLDEEVSMHFRGPLRLSQFAFYAPGGSSSSKKRSVGGRHAHDHAHQHLHQARDNRAAEEKRALGDIVYATIDGQVVSWANNYAGPGASSPTSAPVANAPAANTPAANAPASYAAGAPSPQEKGGSSPAAPVYGAARPKSSPSSSSFSSSDSFLDDATGSTWTRQGYYSASENTADGIVFLNHEGGSGSGVFDYVFGNSLSYASVDGKSGASSPQVLEACELDSSDEIVIMTDQKCEGDSCGYSRPGTVAYHGFNGPSKAFFFEFEMPNTGQQAASKYDPVNMPAVWLLNAEIPRTLQYGKAECSCWESGCGEFDIFEVLAPGDNRCKSTLHGNIAGGDSDYFIRPENGSIRAALLMHDNNIHIKVLPESTQFGTHMPDTFINEMIQDTMIESLNNKVSLFRLSGSHSG